ncbi:MAG: hypothetical protein MUF84_13795 [Anaerolineae bacterium]|jgi:hypothetical protein|nr:hypothetical protein [Anaerolineae bacterium]
MPLSFGIPLGIATILVGAVLFCLTARKRLAKVIVGIGLVIVIVTIALIILAAASAM